MLHYELISVPEKPRLLSSHSTEDSAQSGRSPTGLTELLQEPQGVLMLRRPRWLRAGVQQGVKMLQISGAVDLFLTAHAISRP